MRQDGGVPPLDRLAALDAAFLDLETARAPLHVGWTMRFDGRPPSLGALRRHLAGRLDRVPRFRRVVTRTPGGLAWLDDHGFDVARHVEAVTLPSPGGPGELRETAGILLGRALDPGRPLWRLYLVDGLRDGGFAIVGQAHHALVDGIAAIQVAMLLFDAAGQEPAPPAPGARLAAAWRPDPAPSPLRAVAGGGARAARDAAGAAAALARTARHPSGTAAALRDARGALADVLAPAPPTPLDRSLTAERRIAFAGAPLEDVRAAGRRRGATVNDMLLAASSLALRAALRRRGEHPARLKALVPVNVRAQDDTALGNAISFVAVWLPVDEADPTTVLRAIRDSTRAAKRDGAARPLAAVARAGDLLPAAGRRAVARTAVRAASFNVVVSNVPGPPVELVLLGRRLASVHPAVPLLDGHALSVGALSYAGRLNVGLCADAEALPDAVEIARELESAFDALRLAPERPPAGETPWSRRARDRRGGPAQRAASR
jgi:WS/DGAT/MGAT family acyltransferase